MSRIPTILVVIIACLLLANPLQASDFKRGDVNADDQVDIGDPINLLGILFQSAGDPPCADSADANDDGGIDIGDVITLL